MSDNNESSECNDLRSKEDADIEKLHGESFKDWFEKEYPAPEHGWNYNRVQIIKNVWDHLTEKHAQEKMIFLLTGAEYEREIQALTERVESAESVLKTLDSLWVGYTLTPERMEVRLEINGNEKKLTDSPWDNDSMILSDHCLGHIVKLVKDLQSKLDKAVETINALNTKLGRKWMQYKCHCLNVDSIGCWDCKDTGWLTSDIDELEKFDMKYAKYLKQIKEGE